MRTLHWGISLASLAHLAHTQSSLRCFYPNGNLATGDFPCDPNAQTSPCCGGSLGSVCLSNKLCRGPDGNLIRGSCTDKNWSSPECALFCLSAATGGHDLISCSNVTRTDTSYCCDRIPNHNTDACCDSGVARFEVLPASAQVSATYDPKLSKFSVVPMKTLTLSSTTITPAGSKSPIPSSTPSTPAGANTTPATTSASSTVVTEPPAPGLSTAAQAGIGTGVVIVVVVIPALAYLVWMRKRGGKLAPQQGGPAQGGQPHTPAEHQYEYPAMMDSGSNKYHGFAQQPPRYPAEVAGTTVKTPMWTRVEVDGEGRRCTNYGGRKKSLYELA